LVIRLILLIRVKGARKNGGQEEEAAVVPEDAPQEEQTKTTRKSYTTAFKLQVVREAKLTTRRQAARRLAWTGSK
jgi:hypothetical protein